MDILKKFHIFLKNLDGILYGRSNHSKFKFEHWQVKRCRRPLPRYPASVPQSHTSSCRCSSAFRPSWPSSAVSIAFACRPWLRAVRSLPAFRRRFRDLNLPPILWAFLDADGSAVRQSHPSTPPPTPSSISPLSAVTTLCMLKEDVIDSFFPF